MNYNKSVHMRLSEDQKKALMGLSLKHNVTMSTALRWMIEYCLTDAQVLEAIVPPVELTEGVSLDGMVQEG